jgi:sulfite exporter TauE/SafE
MKQSGRMGDMKINRNVGVLDRVIRMVAGIAFLIAGLTVAKGTAGWILIAFSVPLLASGLLGFCPTYTLFGVSTKRESDCC